MTRKNIKKNEVEESDHHDEPYNEESKEDEQNCRQTYSYYERNKGGAPIERFELPMILEGNIHIHNYLKLCWFSPQIFSLIWIFFNFDDYESKPLLEIEIKLLKIFARMFTLLQCLACGFSVTEPIMTLM